MPRIRTVKPEMWTDGKIVRLSDAANLLFVALLNQADDSGRLKNDPKEIECRAPRFWERSKNLIDELEKVGLVIVYGHASEFLQISNFKKHQVIDRPRPSEIPSPKHRRTIGEHSTQGKEGKGRERKGKDTTMSNAEDLMLLWNDLRRNLPEAQKLTNSRKIKCRERLKERPLEEWKQVISRIAASAFCNGRGNNGWKASFDWLISSEDNAVKTMEGKYDNRNDGSGAAPIPGKYSGLANCQRRQEPERLEETAKEDSTVQ